jgi:4-amino-4-deoxy-L-arabinose transferase-like glycosyltransferase
MISHRSGLLFRLLPIVGLILISSACVVVNFQGLRTNPPGFFLDESSIAYNAVTISQTGRDEDGVRWPVYFRAFGEYKNPAYIYLLAGVFKLTGPSILGARLLSATLGLMASVLIGVLAFLISRRMSVGILMGTVAFFTPWLFEISRLVFEVALFPLVLMLFLIQAYRLSEKTEWSWGEECLLALTLGLLTYTYTIGRLFGPLLAIGLLSFRPRGRGAHILRVWFFYFLSLIPLLAFHFSHPGALLQRFGDVSYLNEKISIGKKIGQFLTQVVGNINPWPLLMTGDPNPRHHIQGVGSFFVVVFLLSLYGIYWCLRTQRNDPWWRFVLYGLVVSVIPVSLTQDLFHTLRLVPYPIFLLILAIPSLGALMRDGSKKYWRLALCFCLIIGIAFQANTFLKLYRQDGPNRAAQFDVEFPNVFDAALAVGARSIYIVESGGPLYIHAYWYGLLQKLDLSRLIRVPNDASAPPGFAVLTYYGAPEGCRTLRHEGWFTAYLCQ